MSERQGCVLTKISADGDLLVFTPSEWAVLGDNFKRAGRWHEMQPRPSFVVRDSGDRVVSLVIADFWKAWVSALERDSRTLLSGYHLTLCTNRYIIYTASDVGEGKVPVADLSGPEWRTKKNQWLATVGNTFVQDNVVCVWRDNDKADIIRHTEWEQVKSKYMRGPIPAIIPWS